MNLSELFIRRPVMTVLLNAAIVLAGVIAYGRIPVAALPSYNTPVINVFAALPGASPETMATSVALPLEKQFATIPGLAVISSSSTLGATSLTLEFDEGRDIDAAVVDVQAALLRAQRSLPQDMTVPPSYRKVNPADAPVLFIALQSASMNLSDLNDYAEHLIAPTLSTLEGVAQVNVYGQKRYAVRVEVHPQALAARNISLDELTRALTAANANTPVGTLDGSRQTLTLQANRQLRNAAEFADLIVASRGGSEVRLRDVATVQDSYETVKTHATLNGETSISLAVLRQPDANTVKVVDEVRAAVPEFKSQLPASVKLTIVNDRSTSIRDALHDVTLTLIGTIALVVLVIFLFLRRVVATLIPTLSLPVSLLGAIALLWAFGYSLDNVSLLGLTLAVGLVVDDAIVMLENVMRHIEQGMAPFEAALKGSREVGFTIISISSSLVAVFIPIFFMPGVIGLLFHEFAVVVSLAIIASAFVSLTLVPMLASRFIRDSAHQKRPGALVRLFERGFDAALTTAPLELELLRLPPAGLRVHDQHGMFRPRGQGLARRRVGGCAFGDVAQCLLRRNDRDRDEHSCHQQLGDTAAHDEQGDQSDHRNNQDHGAQQAESTAPRYCLPPGQDGHEESDGCTEDHPGRVRDEEDEDHDDAQESQQGQRGPGPPRGSSDGLVLPGRHRAPFVRGDAMTRPNGGRRPPRMTAADRPVLPTLPRVRPRSSADRAAAF